MGESIETTAKPSDREVGDVAPVPVSTSPPSLANVIGPQVSEAGIANYEYALEQNPRWALSEGSRHFEGKSAVFDALRKIVKRLTELQIPYAIVGGMALFHHGVRRFTEDVDILVTKQDLKKIHEELAGRGYLPPHRLSKHLRDTELGVRIEFLTTGDYPGDGKEKPVAFPRPADYITLSDGICYINLPKLIELKLASGMTNVGRLRDLADVLELIKLLNLPVDFAEQIDPYVRDKYAELWRQAEVARKYDMLAGSESWGDDEEHGMQGNLA